MEWKRYKPAVEKPLLILLSGLLWMGVGIMLVRMAAGWLAARGGAVAWFLGGLGAVAALLIHHFGFLRVVDKNLGRIRPLPERPCVFAFQSWKSYGLIAVMVGLGVGLRHSPLPKHYLAVIYLGIGAALFLSSLRYLRRFGRQVAAGHPPQDAVQILLVHARNSCCNTINSFLSSYR